MFIQSTVCWTAPNKISGVRGQSEGTGHGQRGDHGPRRDVRGDRFLPGGKGGRDQSHVLGCEVYVAPGSRFDREAGSGEDRYYHLVLLAENDQGYSNLMKIVSKGFVEGFYYKPRVDLELLEEYHEGIIASQRLPGRPRGGPFPHPGDVRGGKKAAARRYRDIFGRGKLSSWRCRITGFPAQQTVNQQLLRMHHEKRGSSWWRPTTCTILSRRTRSPTTCSSACRQGRS